MEGRQRYRQLRNQINREVKKAKEIWPEEQCQGIQKLFKRNRTDQAYCTILNVVENNKQADKTIKNKEGLLYLIH